MKKPFVFLATVFGAHCAFANFECIVDVNRVLIYSNGAINVLHTGRGDYTYVCNLNGTYNGVDAVTCAMWASLLQTSQVNDKKVEFYYAGPGSCATLPIYGSSPAPVYIGLID